MPIKDITGQRFGRLVALMPNHTGPRGTHWKCECDCGTIIVRRIGFLTSGDVKSCGCLKIEAAIATGHANRKHGQTKTRFYGVWSAMIRRCYNNHTRHYPHYGGRGIKVCKRWRKFENFMADMGTNPPGLTLDRIDNDGDYSPGNCRWTTRAEQARNTRKALRVTFNGETLPLKTWAERLEQNYYTLRGRIFLRGMAPEAAFAAGRPDLSAMWRHIRDGY